MRMKTLLALTLLMMTTFAIAKENTDGLIRSSMYELETQLSRTMEDKIVQFVGVENIWVAVHLDVSSEKIKQQLKSSKNSKKSSVKYEELPGLNISADGNIVQDDSSEEKLILDGSKFSIDPALLLSNANGVMVTVYNKDKIDKKVERLIRSLIEDKMSALKTTVGVSFNYRKAKVLETADLKDGKKIRFDPTSFAKSVHSAVTVSFKEFMNDNVIAPLKIGFGAVVFISLAAFGVIGFFLFRALSAINGSLGALLNATKNFETATTQAASPTQASDNGHDKTTTLQSDAVDLQQKILDIYTNYSEVVSSFFMNSMDKKEFKDVWALTQVLGDKILLENKNICRNNNFHLYNKFLQNSMHLVTSAEDFKRIYQKLMSLMLYPEVFFLNSIRNQINSFSMPFLLSNFPKFNENEKLVAIEVLDDLKLATLVNKGLVKTENLNKAEAHHWGMEELKAIDKKLTSIAERGSDLKEIPLLNVMRYFTQSQFDSFIQEQKLNSAYTFGSLYEARKEELEQFFKGLSVEELCALIPMLEEDMVMKVYALLPELKLARVKAIPKNIQDRSFSLMAEIYKMMWSEEFKEVLAGRAVKAKAGPRAA